MTDYTQTIDFSDKDALLTGNPEKVAKGVDLDDELGRISVAIATKYDSADLATQAQAQAGTENAKLMTPLRTEEHMTTWAGENDGMIADIHGFDFSADALLGWDETGSAAIGFTMAAASGLFLNGVTLDWAADTGGAIPGHDLFSDFVAGEHILHSGVTITAGTGLTGGGTIAATRTLNVIGGDGITANANDIALTAQSAGSAVPISIASGVLGWDSAAITELDIGAMEQANDGFLIDDAGALKVMPYDEAGIKVNSVPDATDTLALTDMNTFIEYTDASGGVTVTLNNSIGAKGNIVIIKQTGGSQITLAGSADVQSANGLKTRTTDSVMTLVCLVEGGSAEWALYGDTVV